MKKFLLRGVLYVFVFVVIGNIIAFAGLSLIKNASFFKTVFLENELNRETPFDYVILGSSRGLTTLDSKQMDQHLKTQGVNLSMDDTDIKTHLLMLNHFYQSGYETKYCILTLDYGSFETTSLKLGDNDYQFAPFINRSYVHDHFVKYEEGFLKPIAYSKYLPLLSWSYYNLQLIPASLKSLIAPSYRHRFDEKGNYSYPESDQEIVIERKEITHVKSISNPIINQFLELLSKHGTELIIYVAPYGNLNLLIDSKLQIINHSSLINEAALFYDHLHVNNIGREMVTHEFVNEFSKIRAN